MKIHKISAWVDDNFEEAPEETKVDPRSVGGRVGARVGLARR